MSNFMRHRLKEGCSNVDAGVQVAERAEAMTGAGLSPGLTLIVGPKIRLFPVNRVTVLAGDGR